VLVISRDIVVVLGTLALHFFHIELRIKPTMLGKIATVSQMVAIGFAMLLTTNQWKTKFIDMELAFLDLPVFIAGFFTLISGLDYVRYGLRQIHAKGHGEPKPPSEF
jgi:phosphatidylglycerophosphate synthase